ncbi:CPBP family intramembrane glutamic endopeptidase [Streptomonospora wellingtoniae]|uniref:CPBP family intramembrane glutamic endopeptidase n=1 Tax=Streptomonospora wellingtoniae TaxID=3075544 RepID=A0ABU2KR59_9ACTN|nr:CPBP family intramembrane glutamic endopeptidase [Streptomonospora sp. DSM 45055]MDT0301771.1 CPBP family intramembrane glutamic endopeptidase [Streptomonospora sp. DSM 45055]
MNPDADRLLSPPHSRPADAALPTDPDPDGRGPRPVPPGVEYHRVLAGDKRRIGRGVLAIVLVIAGMAVFSFAASQAAAFVDTQLGRTNPASGGTDYTPLYHGATMFSLALLIPWSMLVQRWLYGVRGASLHSVVSRFRFDVFGRALLFIGPVWLIAVLVLNASTPPEQTHWPVADLVGIFAATLLLTPLQSAGEEYGLRGLVFRVAGSWSRGPRTALVVGVLVSSLVFTLIHGAADPWINLWYFTLAVSLAVITWRTGGIETAAVMHALLNTLTFLFATALHIDIGTSVADRSAGTGSAVLLVPTLTAAAIAAVVWLRTRTTGPALTPADPRPARTPAAQ